MRWDHPFGAKIFDQGMSKQNKIGDGEWVNDTLLEHKSLIGEWANKTNFLVWGNGQMTPTGHAGCRQENRHVK